MYQVNISQTVHKIHYIFGSRLGFLGLAEQMVLFSVHQVAALLRVTITLAGFSCYIT